jgi:phosphoglucosamine mutase
MRKDDENMKKQFGTDGVRGEANDKLTPALAYRVGAALTLILKKETERPLIVVGRDTRLSGDMLEGALAAGVAAYGGILLKLGIIPTPAVSCFVRECGADAGVVISASHNPFWDNGIKIFGADGRKFPDRSEDEIETLLAAEELPPACRGEKIGYVRDNPAGGRDYLDRLKKFFPLDLSGFRLVVDTANGSTSDFAPSLLRDLGAEVIAMNTDYDGVNINDHCGSTKPEAMTRKVLDTGADVGIAYDGDGDRLIMADHEGTIVDGDKAMAVMATYLKEKGELAGDRLVVTVMSNLGLKLAMEKAGIVLSETSVGDKNVMAEMDRAGAVLGGEQSGHLILSQYNPTGDGILSSLMILKIISETGKSLKELASVMTALPQRLYNITVGRRDEWSENEAVMKSVAEAEAALSGRGRILIRPSGTEPLLRVMGEGPDEEELDTILKGILAVMEQELN